MTRGHGGHGGIDNFGGHQPARTSYFAVKAALLPTLVSYCGEDSWQVSQKRDRQVLTSPTGEDFTGQDAVLAEPESLSPLLGVLAVPAGVENASQAFLDAAMRQSRVAINADLAPQ